MEEWRKVPDYENYEINIEGEPKCRNIRTGKYLKNIFSNSKYFQWGLSKNGVNKTYQIGRWIALTFPELIENEYFEGAEIDHKDTNRLNNHPSNLHWVTRKENINNPLTKIHQKAAQKNSYKPPHSKETKEKMSISHKGLLLNNEALSNTVFQYTLDGTFIASYPSQKEAERITGVDNSHISDCVLGKRKTAGTRDKITGKIIRYKWKSYKIEPGCDNPGSDSPLVR